MSRIVFLGAPAFGHVNPTLPVVQELVQRGEEVDYYDTEEFRSLIERTGATFHPYSGTDFNSAVLTSAIGDGNLSNLPALIASATESFLPSLLDELSSQRPELVIFDSMALWGKMATTSLHLREAASISHFVIDTVQGEIKLSGRELWRYLRPVLPKLPRFLAARSRLIRKYGDAFPRISPLFPMRGGLNIVYTSRELHPATPLIDDTFRFVGPSIKASTRSEDFPFDYLRQDVIAYISLGTIHHGQVEFYRQCFEAFGSYPAQFVLSAGRNTDLQAVGEIPENFIVRPSVPQLEILQRADVFITHGGMNSIQEGLYYGVPLILIPHHIEQLINSRVVERQGAGITIDKQFAGKPVRVADLRPAFDEILSKPQYREAANKIQQTLRATGGYRQAADEIQRYLAETKSAAN